MKPIVLAAAFVLIGSPVLAQSVTESKTVTTTTIAPAEETQMREYIVHEHPAPVPPPPGFSVSTGVVVPETVTLYHFPEERHWGYEYTTIGDRTVLVDPRTREIVHVFR